MSNPVIELQKYGQSVWYDNIRRSMLDSGELQHLIDNGVVGVTSNPTIFEKAMSAGTEYDASLSKLALAGRDLQGIYEGLVMEDIAAAADLLRPIFDRTKGRDGYVSIEVRPTLAHDTTGTVAEARRLFAALGRPNVMIKVPATPEGIPAIETLIGDGINVNVTLIFALASYEAAANAYVAGLERLAARGGDLRKVASVASFFVSRVDTAVDRQLEALIKAGRSDLQPLLGKAAIANAKLAYERFKVIFGSPRFAALRASGAYVQRPLWASTGTKNPLYSDVMYLDGLIGPDTVNTVPPATLAAFQDHGRVEATLEAGLDDAKLALKHLGIVGISMDAVTQTLLDEGVASFTDSFEKLLTNLDAKRAALIAAAKASAPANVVAAALADVQERRLVGRIWAKDYTVWKPDPTEISNRLGWLTIGKAMQEHVVELDAFAAEVRQAGFADLVLLGMGGSSLAPEVLRVAFGAQPGSPRLHVLDSTVPAWVQRVTASIDPLRTLFIVSSKSGGTIEVVSFFKHFYGLVAAQRGAQAGQNFVAITDPGTGMQKLAEDNHFRRVWLNPPDIGGRYSALSYFGLVPAVLAGIKVGDLLARGETMAGLCSAATTLSENPGAALGAALAGYNAAGRDKVTFVTSPAIAVFGLWAEQLIAESTGKEGKGITPIALEPSAPVACYGNDRVFAYLRLDGDDNQSVDAQAAALEQAGQPVLRFKLSDRYDLGGEFFRWEFATAVAGALLGIQPFDQPNVQESKDNTGAVLQQVKTTGKIPETATTGSLQDLLAQAKPGDYLALMAYIDEMPDVDAALNELRSGLLARYHLANTLGYGPRFLHSTGQLHKGGPNTGLFVQLAADWGEDVPVPGETYTFAGLAAAQVAGDYTSLLNHGRRVLRINLGGQPVAGIRKLAQELSR